MLAFLWCVVQILPRSLSSPTPSQGPVWLAWRVSGEQGRWLALGQDSIPEYPASLVVPSLLLKVLVPSNILCREGEKIYSGNYSPTVW